MPATYETLVDGVIDLDTERGKLFDFTRERFGGYLWKKDDRIIISFIISKQRGNFRELVEAIHQQHLAVVIPTPLGRMQDIVRKEGYHQTFPWSEECGENVEMWTLEPPEHDTPSPT